MSFQIPRKIEIAILSLLVLFGLVFALSEFKERPALWFDEGITIEIARNFSLFGELDVLTAPDTFSGFAYLVGTNGYPLTVPLALFYKMFGFSFLGTRIFMLLWFAGTIGVLYLVARKLAGPMAALSATALLLSFASFYGNGLTATGEMPGLFFFILGIWFLIGRQSYFWTGIFWGLSMASKPGVFLLLAHTMVLFIIIADRKGWFKKLLKAGVGFFIPVAVWIVLVFPLTLGTFYSVVAYVLNPIDLPIVASLLQKLPQETLNEGLIVPNIESASNNISTNLKLFLTHSTLIYFSILALIVIVGLSIGRKGSEYERKVLWIVVLYGFLAIFYFVRGPGWLRYLLGIEILLFIPLYPALENIFRVSLSRLPKLRMMGRINASQIACTAIICLFVLQIVQLYFFSNIPDSKGIIESVEYVTEKMEQDKDMTVGIYNVPELAAFTDPSRTYHMSLPQKGSAPLGESPLLMKTTPAFIVISREDVLVGEDVMKILEKNYKQTEEIKKFNVYEMVK